MFQPDPELPEWDSYDEELLWDVRETTVIGCGGQGNHSGNNTCLNPSMKPKDLPDTCNP